MKRFLLVSILLFILISLNGQNILQKEKLKNGLGFAAGINSGVGFAYKHKFNRSAYQITFGALYHNSDYDCYYPKEDIMEGSVDTTKVWIEKCDGPQGSGNIGFEYYFYLHQAKRSAFYLSVGTAVFSSINKSKNQKYSYVNIDSTHYKTEKVGNEYYKTENNTKINTWFGIGIEYKITKNIITSLGLPISFSFSDENGFNMFMLIPQISILYYFK